MAFIQHACCGCGSVFIIRKDRCKDGMDCPACRNKLQVADTKKDKPANLLTIELQDELSVPKVFYKGEEVRLKQHVFFDWDTDTSIPGGLTYTIEHAVEGKAHPTSNRIERRVKGHATT